MQFVRVMDIMTVDYKKDHFNNYITIYRNEAPRWPRAAAGKQGI